MNYIKFIRIFLLILIVIGVGLIITQKMWVPKVVNQILGQEGIASGQADLASKNSLISTKTVAIAETNTWEVYKNEKYGIEFSYPKNSKISEELQVPNSDPNYLFGSKYFGVEHSSFGINIDISFDSQYDNKTIKNVHISVEDIADGQGCELEPHIYAYGKRIMINGREYFFTKSYDNFDSFWVQTLGSTTTEAKSNYNNTRADYVTKTNSFCYSIVFSVSGSSPKSEEIKFFESEFEIFNKILNTIKISGTQITPLICEEDDFDCLIKAVSTCTPGTLLESPKGVFPSSAYYQVVGPTSQSSCRYAEGIMGTMVLSDDNKKIINIDNSKGASLVCIASVTDLSSYLLESFKQLKDLRAGVDDPSDYTKTDNFMKTECAVQYRGPINWADQTQP